LVTVKKIEWAVDKSLELPQKNNNSYCSATQELHKSLATSIEKYVFESRKQSVLSSKQRAIMIDKKTQIQRGRFSYFIRFS